MSRSARPTRRLLWCFALVVCTFFWTSSASAQTDGDPELQPADSGDSVSDFDRLVTEGAEAYGKRDYNVALEKFQAAYALDPVPDLLFNMGILADSLGEFELALGYLNEFVVQPDIDVDARKEALSRIEQLQQLQALQNKKDEPDPIDTKKDETVTGPAPLPPEPTPEPNYTGPGIVLGIGLVTLAGGGVTAGLALTKHDEFESAQTLQDRRDAADSGETLALVSDILLPAGGVITAAGIIWLAIEATSDGGDGGVAVAPSLSPDGAGLDLRVQF